MVTCSIEGCEKPGTHPVDAFILPMMLCCDHAQQRLEVVEKQVKVLSAELEGRGLTVYGQELAMKGVSLLPPEER